MKEFLCKHCGSTKGDDQQLLLFSRYKASNLTTSCAIDWTPTRTAHLFRFLQALDIKTTVQFKSLDARLKEYNGEHDDNSNGYLLEAIQERDGLVCRVLGIERGDALWGATATCLRAGGKGKGEATTAAVGGDQAEAENITLFEWCWTKCVAKMGRKGWVQKCWVELDKVKTLRGEIARAKEETADTDGDRDEDSEGEGEADDKLTSTPEILYLDLDAEVQKMQDRYANSDTSIRPGTPSQATARVMDDLPTDDNSTNPNSYSPHPSSSSSFNLDAPDSPTTKCDDNFFISTPSSSTTTTTTTNSQSLITKATSLFHATIARTKTATTLLSELEHRIEANNTTIATQESTIRNNAVVIDSQTTTLDLLRRSHADECQKQEENRDQYISATSFQNELLKREEREMGAKRTDIERLKRELDTLRREAEAKRGEVEALEEKAERKKGEVQGLEKKAEDIRSRVERNWGVFKEIIKEAIAETERKIMGAGTVSSGKASLETLKSIAGKQESSIEKAIGELKGSGKRDGEL